MTEKVPQNQTGIEEDYATLIQTEQVKIVIAASNIRKYKELAKLEQKQLGKARKL